MTRRPLLTFFLAVYAVSWTCWMTADAITRRVPSPSPGLAALRGALFLLGTFAPGLLGLAFTATLEGRAAARDLLGRILRWDVGLRWYVFAVAFMPAIKLSAAVLHRAIVGAWPPFGQEAWYVMAGAILISTWAQAGEEVGWRGYALPRLAHKFGLGPASVVLGLVWAAWHLPFFFIPAADTRGQSFPLYLLQVTALSVAMAWLYWSTGGSLLLVMILHAAVNNTKDIVPSAVPGATDPFALSTSLVAWITVALLWIADGYFLIRMRGAGLPPEREEGQNE